MLLVEDLMVVLVRKSSGPHPWQGGVVGALAAALLIELAERGRIEVARDDALVVVDGPPFGDDLLDVALLRTGGTTEESITRVADGLYQRVLDRLTGYGLLRRVTFLWRVADPTYAEALRREITLVLLGDLAPSHRTGPIITLLSALTVVDKVARRLPPSAWVRADEIAAGGWPARPETLAVAELCLQAARGWFKTAGPG